jgi:DNA-directed RNA polymerase subunit omega
MARITIEDCMEHVPNRFHLVRIASIRAKQLRKGALPLLTSEDNKQIVMSLREIAAGLVKASDVESAGPVDTSVEDTAADLSVAAAEAVQTEEASSQEEAAAAVEPGEAAPLTEATEATEG